MACLWRMVWTGQYDSWTSKEFNDSPAHSMDFRWRKFVLKMPWTWYCFFQNVCLILSSCAIDKLYLSTPNTIQNIYTEKLIVHSTSTVIILICNCDAWLIFVVCLPASNDNYLFSSYLMNGIVILENIQQAEYFWLSSLKWYNSLIATFHNIREYLYQLSLNQLYASSTVVLPN